MQLKQTPLISARWSKKEKKYVTVDRPNIVGMYNAKMGGVDLADRMLSFYRMSARTKKWTVRTIMHFVDLAVVNSWIEYRSDQETMQVPSKSVFQLFDFKFGVAEKLIQSACQNNFCEASDHEPPQKKGKVTLLPSSHHR